jgi:ATP-dependent exoDNAse (exonuclease V) beta subunit
MVILNFKDGTMKELTNRVSFDEASHTYTNYKGSKYTSATTLIGKFKQPFDKKAVATAYAKKNGKTPQYWIDKWEEISKKACEKGTNFHKGKESHLLSLDGIVKEDRVIQVVDINKFTEPNIDYSTLPDGVYPELILWNHYWGVAGISDIIIIDGDYFDVDDYKTNKKIDKESYCHPKYGHKMMKPPINHLMDCNYTHYALQLSLYAYMLEKLTGKKARNLSFHHHPPHIDNPDMVSVEGIKYTVPYLKSEVIAMLITYRGKPEVSL